MTKNEAVWAVKVNWPVILFLIVQTSAAVWWAASVSTSIGFLKENINRDSLEVHRLTRNCYTQADADRAHEYILKRLEILENDGRKNASY